MTVVFNNPTIRRGGIVKSDLILHLDAADPFSYPRSGTIWYDLSGNGNHFTLNNMSYNSNGYFTLNGTSSYAISTNNLDLSPYTSVTCEVMIRPVVGTSSMVYEHTTNWNSQSGGFGFNINSAGGTFTANVIHSNHNPASTTWGRNYNSNTNSGNWGFHSQTFSRVVDSKGRYAIQDGQEKPFTSSPYSSSTATTTNTTFVSAKMHLGSRAGSVAWYSGDLASFKVYGRKQDLADHSLNFNTIRGRFGI